jgi:hypothetical protein
MGLSPSATALSTARWWLRRTYYLFQMPRWDRRLRIVLDWTVALFFLPDIARVPCAWERAGEADAPVGGEVLGNSSGQRRFGVS